MGAPPATVVDLEAVESALLQGRPVDEVLDLVDDVIEHAASGDADSLDRLAALLERAADGRAEARGLAVAARRAGLARSKLPTPAPAVPETAGAAPEIAETVQAGPRVTAPAAAVPYAGWWRRALAFVVDWLAIFATVAFPPLGDTAMLVAFFVVPVAYFAGLHAFVNGQTIGKGLFGIAVRLADGRPVDLAGAVVRALVQGVLWVTVIGGVVDALAPIGDSRNRALHDRAAGTIVVSVR